MLGGGVRALLLEVPEDYADDFAKGDFSYLLETTSGARRLRVAQAFRAQGIAVLAADVAERWMSLNPLALRKKNPSFKTFDERWMQMRNNHFVDVAQKQLTRQPGSKVVLLVGAAHATLVGKLARGRGISCHVIDVSERDFSRSTENKMLGIDDNIKDVQIVLETLNAQVSAATAELRAKGCPWPGADWDSESQRQFLASRQAMILLRQPATQRAARPLEIVLRAIAQLQITFPETAKMARALALKSASAEQERASRLAERAATMERLLNTVASHDSSGGIAIGSANGRRAFFLQDPSGTWTEKVENPDGQVFTARFRTEGEILCPEAP